MLKMSKHFRKADIRLDDDLTQLQQQERRTLGMKSHRLKTKGHEPVFRGLQLKFYFNNSAHTCLKGQACKADAVQ